MMFKNSIKLFCSNFSKVWKYLLYSIIVTGIVVGLMMPFFADIKAVVVTVYEEINVDFIKSIPSAGLIFGNNISELIAIIWSFCYNCVITIFIHHFWESVYLSCLVLVVLPFLMNVGKYVFHETLYNYMSSKTKSSFCAVLVKTLRRSTSYAILKTLMSIIWKAMIVAGIYGLTLVSFPMYEYFLPVIIVVGGAFVTAIAQTIISGWAPASVVYNFNVSKSFNLGAKAVRRKYGRILSTSFFINLIMMLLIMGFGLVSSVIIIPLYLGLNNMFEMVMFFTSQGMRFYVDGENVVAPKKLEQQDTIKKTKFLL